MKRNSYIILSVVVFLIILIGFTARPRPKLVGLSQRDYSDFVRRFAGLQGLRLVDPEKLYSSSSCDYVAKVEIANTRECLFYCNEELLLTRPNTKGQCLYKDAYTNSDNWVMKEVYNFQLKLNGDFADFYFDSEIISLILAKNFQVNPRETNKRSLANGEICFDVDDSCRITQEDHCDQCLEGSYTVIASECRKNFRKVCGQRKCGIKGGVACIRGYEVTGFNLDYCMNDSPVGFCLDSSRVFCQDGVLTCN